MLQPKLFIVKNDHQVIQHEYPDLVLFLDSIEKEKSSDTSDTNTAQKTGTTQAVSSYVYDATSGYYYDTTTGLYYDPNSQVHTYGVWKIIWYGLNQTLSEGET